MAFVAASSLQGFVFCFLFLCRVFVSLFCFFSFSAAGSALCRALFRPPTGFSEHSLLCSCSFFLCSALPVLSFLSLLLWPQAAGEVVCCVFRARSGLISLAFTELALSLAIAPLPFLPRIERAFITIRASFGHGTCAPANLMHRTARKWQTRQSTRATLTPKRAELAEARTNPAT